jgi:hypothetical protein
VRLSEFFDTGNEVGNSFHVRRDNPQIPAVTIF